MGGGARGGGRREAKVGDENKQTPKPNRKKRAGAQTEYRRRKMEIQQRQRRTEETQIDFKKC